MQAKNEGGRLVCANVYGLCWSLGLLARMECAALCSYLNVQPCQGFYTKQVFQSAGSTVVSSYCSPADLAKIIKLPAVAGLWMWESHMRFPSLASARRHLQAGQAATALASSGGRYGSPLASTAQAMRASLLARTTVTILW